MTIRQISVQHARQLNITKQHLDGGPQPDLYSVIRDLGCLQLDPIRAVERPHMLIPWSRLGDAFNPAELKKLRWEDRKLFEYWAHAASIVLTEEFPIHAWYMNFLRTDPKRAQRTEAWFAENPFLHEIKAYVLNEIKAKKAVFARDLKNDALDPGFQSVWWAGKYANLMLDHLWSRGDTTVVGRKGNQKQWGMLEDFLPEWTPREAWTEQQVTRYAAQKAVRALGVATQKQIKIHYTRQRYPKLKKTLDALTHENQLIPVEIVDGETPLKGEFYLHADDFPLLEALERGRFIPRTALLSPFDNLICDRDRTEQLFDFHYRIEIYVPAKKRQYGYYVLPILHGDRFIGRINAKMERKKGQLHIFDVYAEDNAPTNATTVDALRKEIYALATFLDAKDIVWGNIPQQWKPIHD